MLLLIKGKLYVPAHFIANLNYLIYLYLLMKVITHRAQKNLRTTAAAVAH